MEQKRIIAQTPGKTIYAGKKDGEVFHYFTDAYFCPITQESLEIPGKGALSHRISAFFFSRLQSLNIPSHFIRALNMRESLMYATTSLPFDVVVRCQAMGDFAHQMTLPHGKFFDRPLLEYRCSKTGRLLSESVILGLDWLMPDELEDLQILVARTVDYLKGMLMAFSLHLVEISLSIGKSQEEDFFIAGNISPEVMCVFDEENKDYWGFPYILQGPHNPEMHYQKIAMRLGIHLGGPSISKILPFPIQKIQEQ